jgi:hypothetical protein
MIILIVDAPDAGILRLTLQDADGTTRDTLGIPLEGFVDNLLLTAVDNLLKRHTIDKFALGAVRLGAGVDKNSSFCRIVRSLASAVAATAAGGR